MNSPNTNGENQQEANVEKHSPYTTTTLIYVFNPDGQMLLATKKKTNSGFDISVEKVNTAGGKKDPGETTVECALRELEDEFGIIASENQLIPAGILRFHFKTKHNRDQECNIYKIVNYTGKYKDSDEMAQISYHNINDLPWEKMWESDSQRMPDMLAGKEIKDVFYHTDDGKVIDRKPLINLEDDTRLYRQNR